MKSRTFTAFLWLLAIGVFLLAFSYHHSLKQIYDHYLLDTVWLINIPVVLALSNLLPSITGRKETKLSPSTRRILILIFIVLFIVALFFIIKPFLGLEFLLVASIFIALLIFFPLEQKRLKEGRPANLPRIGAISILLYCFVIIALPFSYIQVTNPLTLEESKAIIARDYPSYAYYFCSTDTKFQRELDTSLGYYIYGNGEGGLHQSVRTGDIAFTASPFGF